MRLTIATLTLAYVLSQFYRAFLAVLSPMLTQDLGIPAEVLARASGWWFLASRRRNCRWDGRWTGSGLG